jgi:flagellar motor switch/type III secretory pathway protein FliN
MKKIAVFTLVTGLIAANILAAPFEELFQIQNITGKCYVKAADASRFVKAEPNKAYPYGTSVKTAKKGSATIVFSKDNTCELKANTIVVISEEKNKKNKIIEISTGNIDVNLEKKFHKSNGLKIVTATGTCKAIGCVFSVSASNKSDMNASTYKCKEGKIGLSGPDYSIAELNDKDEIAVTTADDNSFTRIETIKGKVNIEVKNAQGIQEIKKTKEGSVIKIWRRASDSGNNKIVTILITDPEGALKEAITYTEPTTDKLPKKAAVAIPATAVASKGKKTPKKSEQEQADSNMQDTGELLDIPIMLGLSSAKGDEKIKEEEDAKKPVPIPPPKPRPDPTPTGSK